MKPIDVLAGIDRPQDEISVDVSWQGQLYKNAIDRGVEIQSADQG